MSDAVSLTMGNSGLPLADGLPADADGFCDEFLRHFAARAVRFQRFAERFLRLGLFLPHLTGAQVFEQRPDQKHEQKYGRAEHADAEQSKNQCFHERIHPFCVWDGFSIAKIPGCCHQLSRKKRLRRLISAAFSDTAP